MMSHRRKIVAGHRRGITSTVGHRREIQGATGVGLQEKPQVWDGFGFRE
jgi:hypothetical protein